MEFTLTDYINCALAYAEYDKLEDGTFSGRIPKCKGVIALTLICLFEKFVIIRAHSWPNKEAKVVTFFLYPYLLSLFICVICEICGYI